MLTIKQAAERLQCSQALVYQLCASRKLTHVRLGIGRGTIRIREEDLLAFISGATVQPREKPAPKPAPINLQHLRLPS